MLEAKFVRTLRQIEKEAIQAPSAKAGATPLSAEVGFARRDSPKISQG